MGRWRSFEVIEDKQVYSFTALLLTYLLRKTLIRRQILIRNILIGSEIANHNP